MTDGHKEAGGSFPNLAHIAAVLLNEQTLYQINGLIVEMALAGVPQCADASISVTNSEKPYTAASSSQRAEALDIVQYESDAGPCLEAGRSGEVVRFRNGTIEQKWPAFAASASARGIQSSLSFPLKSSESLLGALNLYSDRPDGVRADGLRLVELLAEQASMALAGGLAGQSEPMFDTRLKDALASRETIAEAKGIVMEREGCSPEEAFTILRTMSQHSNIKLRDLAREIVASATHR